MPAGPQEARCSIAMTDATPLLSVRDLHVWFDLANGRELHAVQGISLDLEKGTRLGLVGESGCGKTTAILAMMGLLPPTASVAGEVMLGGVNVLQSGEQSVRAYRWKDLAMVFQGAMNSLNPVKTVGSQIVEALEFHRVARGGAARRRVCELFELLGISAQAIDRFPHEFSGGMRQRAAIAMALACEPSVLLADEPTTALDVMVQAQISELLVRLTDELGMTLILVTHDLPLVAQMCGRVAVMYAGQITESGLMDTVFHAPRHPYTRMLFAATPDLYGEDEVVSIPGEPPRLDHEIAGCPFRPRCDRAFGRCIAEKPLLKAVAPLHWAACHLNDAEAGAL